MGSKRGGNHEKSAKNVERKKKKKVLKQYNDRHSRKTNIEKKKIQMKIAK